MSNIPHRKRMVRPARLHAAVQWIPRYRGKSLVRGYCKFFGVDVPCALTELNILGVKLDPDYVQQLKRSWDSRIKEKQKRAELARIRKREEEAPWALEDSDDYLKAAALLGVLDKNNKVTIESIIVEDAMLCRSWYLGELFYQYNRESG